MGMYTNPIWHDKMSEAETALADQIQDRKFIGYGEWDYYKDKEEIPQGEPGDYLVLSYESESIHMIYWQKDHWRIKDVELAPQGATFTNDHQAKGQ